MLLTCFLIWTVEPFCIPESDEDPPETYFCRWEQKRLPSPTQLLTNLSVSSEYECVVNCMTTESCVAVNYITSKQVCEMYAAEEELINGELIDDDVSVHYSTLLC